MTVALSFCTNCGKPNAAYTAAQSGGPGSKVVLDRTLYPLCLLSCIICRPRKSSLCDAARKERSCMCVLRAEVYNVGTVWSNSVERRCTT